MFTGIVETMGELVKVEEEQNNLHFHIRSNLTKELKIDQSLAHDGVCLTVVDCWAETYQPKYGEVDAKAGELSSISLVAATEALQKGQTNALVTAPIHKSAIQSENFRFPGHTDYLAQAFDEDALMFLVHPGLRVALVTDHVAVKDIPQYITSDCVTQKLNTVAYSLQLNVGDLVNLEFDMIGKYILKNKN